MGLHYNSPHFLIASPYFCAFFNTSLQFQKKIENFLIHSQYYYNLLTHFSLPINSSTIFSFRIKHSKKGIFPQTKTYLPNFASSEAANPVRPNLTRLSKFWTPNVLNVWIKSLVGFLNIKIIYKAEHYRNSVLAKTFL